MNTVAYSSSQRNRARQISVGERMI